MKFSNTDVWGFEHAIRGMRNPLESWDKSDSYACISLCDGNCPFYTYHKCKISGFCLGKNDRELAQKLIKAGSEHRKFMRQIMVSVDITAPLYWWKEFDTYKVGTVANSTSTMHKLASTPITIECFECSDMVNKSIVQDLEKVRQEYVKTKAKGLWKYLIVNLPCSWLQTRTVTLNYENILSMIRQRQNHKLTEWSIDFMNWVNDLPYSKELLFNDVL